MADKYEDEILEGEVSDDDDQEENKKEPGEVLYALSSGRESGW